MQASVLTSAFTPNFTHDYSVILPHPIAEVFSVLGTSAGHERVCRLSGLCTKFQLLEQDSVALPESVSLAQVHARTAPAATSDSTHPSDSPTRTLPRHSFMITETVRVLFGLISTDVHLSGTLTWDEQARVALYETQSDAHVQVWKLRIFEVVEGNQTRVKERVEGICPRMLQFVVQKEAAKSHAYVHHIFPLSLLT